MINLQLLELPMSRTSFHGPKDVQDFEVRLHLNNALSYIQKMILIFTIFWVNSADDRFMIFF